jgi:hypothetical protein
LGPYNNLPITNALPSYSHTPLFFPQFFAPKLTPPNSTGAIPNSTAAPTTLYPSPTHSPLTP